MPSWVVRPFRADEDFEPVAKLAKEVYGQTQLADKPYLEWRFKKNPEGAFLAAWENRSAIIGFQALIPVRVKVGNEIFLWAWGGDSMVHPQYRRQGIFVAMARSTYEQARGKISAVYGTREVDHPTMHALLNHLEYTRAGNIAIFKKYLRPASAVRPFWDIRGRPGFENYRTLTVTSLAKYVGRLFELVTTSLSSKLAASTHDFQTNSSASAKIQELKLLVFSEEFDRLWLDVRDSFKIGVVKDSRFLNWRYANPAATYTCFKADQGGILVGYAVLSYTSEADLKTAWLADLLASNIDVAAGLLKACLKRAAEDQAHLFTMYGNRQTESFRKSLGIISGWPRTIPLAIRSAGGAPSDTVRDVSNWYLNVVDTEDWI